MHAAHEPRAIIIVAWMHRLVLGGFFLLGGVVLVSGTGIFAIPGVVVLAVGVLATRGGRVEFRSDELVIRQTWRTRRIPRGASSPSE